MSEDKGSKYTNTNTNTTINCDNENDNGRIETSHTADDDGANVAFQDLHYSVPVKTNEDGTLQILSGISGTFLPGRMSALMGPSGSGKTTLLDLLAGRKNTGSMEGRVLINGSQPSRTDLKLMVGYVEQFDTLVGELTVAQMLTYTAELKLPADTSAAQRRERVEEVIAKLDLGSCRNTVIGNALQRGISGGQAKRVNIGLAMITRPKILYLDEPTSGLDSRTANEVVELLRQLAREGRTVVCTIHSPTGHAFKRFDDLHMLHAGKTIYDGPIGGAQAYFEELVGQEMEPDCSLPEWLVDLTSELPAQHSNTGHHDTAQVADDGDGDGDGEGATTASATASASATRSDRRQLRNFSALYEESQSSVLARERLNSVVSVKSVKPMVHPKPPSEMKKLATLLKFRMVAHYKDGEFLGTRFGDKILFALLILSLYWGIGNNPDSQSILSTSSLLYFICAICGYGAAAFVPSLTLERTLYYRELADGCYTPFTYYAFKFVEEGLLATITSLLFCVMVHFSCSLQGRFIIFALCYYLTTMMGIILAYAVAAVAPTMDAANAILPALVTIWMYFGGLFIVFDKIPNGWYWFSWTSFLRYSWGAMMLNQFQDEETGSVPVFVTTENGDGSGSASSSLNVLEFYGLEGKIMGSIGACLGLLGTLILFFSAVGVLALTFVRHDKR